MTMTPTPAPRYGRRELPTKADFAPLDRKADSSRNGRRGARKSNRKTRTIL